MIFEMGVEELIGKEAGVEKSESGFVFSGGEAGLKYRCEPGDRFSKG